MIELTCRLPCQEGVEAMLTAFKESRFLMTELLLVSGQSRKHSYWGASSSHNSSTKWRIVGARSAGSNWRDRLKRDRRREQTPSFISEWRESSSKAHSKVPPSPFKISSCACGSPFWLLKARSRFISPRWVLRTSPGKSSHRQSSPNEYMSVFFAAARVNHLE